MGQTYDNTKPTTGSTTFGELYQILRNHFDACATLFVGASAPSSPEEGRPWWDSTNKKLKVYDATAAAWRDADYSSSLYTEIVAARGTASALNTRLSVSLNPDGSMAGATPAGSWWTSGTTPCRYLSGKQFKINGDKRGIYTKGRAVYTTVTSVIVYSYVTNTTYAGATTTVSLKDGVLAPSMTTVYYGQVDANYHGRMPWTRVLFANSATSRDYAASGQTVRSDGSGGVTTAAVRSKKELLQDNKLYGVI